MRRRPSQSEIAFAPEPVITPEPTITPRRPWPGKPERPFKHTPWQSGGNENIRMHFAPGTRGGRRLGVPNKFGANLKQQILDAAARCKHSKDGTLESFLEYCATEFPQAYLKVIAKLIPYRIDLTHLKHVQTADEIRGALRQRGIDIDRIFPIPKVPEQIDHKPAEQIKPRDEDHLERELPGERPRPEPQQTNGLDRRYDEPLRDVRAHDATIYSPTHSGWYPINTGAPNGHDDDDDPQEAAE
jgi:hypothetical protein